MSAAKDGAVLGLGAAACAACCAGPILGVLAAIGVGTALGVAVLGAGGLAIAALLLVPIVRRRRPTACAAPETTLVAVGRKQP